MKKKPLIRAESDLIADWLLMARERLNRHGLALDFQVWATEESRDKLADLNAAFRQRGSAGFHMGCDSTRRAF
jgi:hypothetical protein